MKPVVYHRLAENELIRSAAFYEQRRPFLGEQFLVAIDQSIETIRRHPHIGRPEKLDTRSFPVKKFPFRMVYQEQPDRIWIVAVAHLSRKPCYWEKRLAR